MSQLNMTNNLSENLLQNQPIGWVMVILSIAFITLYFPCGIVLWQKTQLKNSCYKIMAWMAIVDIFNLFVGGTLAGILSIVGIDEKFLSTKIDKTWGFACSFCWYIYGSFGIVLAINRCIHIKSESLSEVWFAGKKIYFWLIACGIYCIPINAVFLTPLASLPYHPKYCVFFFDNVATVIIGVHNWAISIILPIIHVGQYYFLRLRMSSASNQQQLSIYERRLIYQGAAICMSTAVAAISYCTFPMFLNLNNIWIMQLLWFWAHGGNAIIYLAMNKTIRRKVAKMFGISLGIISVGPTIPAFSHVTTN